MYKNELTTNLIISGLCQRGLKSFGVLSFSTKYSSIISTLGKSSGFFRTLLRIFNSCFKF